MIEPTQATCGCRFCLQCINPLLTEQDTKCPNCKDQNVERLGLMRDRAVEKEIMNLQIKCTNDDCKETLLIKHLPNHLRECDYRKLQCDKCDQWYTNTQKQHHVTNQCDKSMTVCIDCNIEMTREYFVNTHRNYSDNVENICETWVSECPYKCEDLALVNLKIHLQICANRPIPCPLREIGCTVIESSEALNIHMKEDGAHHQTLMMVQIQRLRTNNVELKESYRVNEEKFKLENEHLRSLISENESEVRKLTMKIDQLNHNLETLVEELKKYKQQLNIDVGELSKDIVCNNNSVTWTIRDIRSKINAAKLGINEIICSDNFYIPRAGYNMSLKIYPNGDGRAKNAFMSAYFVINKGDYDNNVSWPFQSKVTLSLLSSKPTKESINVHMKPDNNQACYGRPDGINVGAGQPQFISLSEILNYVYFLHNGALKISISVQSIG